MYFVILYRSCQGNIESLSEKQKSEYCDNDIFQDYHSDKQGDRLNEITNTSSC